MTQQEQQMQLEKINKLKKEGAEVAKSIIDKMNKIDAGEITSRAATYERQGKAVAARASSVRSW
jgi:hypothetical protein